MLHTKTNYIVQPKLTVNTPGDVYEQEADAMANQVMRMSSNQPVKSVTGLIGKSLQRKCAHCEEEEKKKPLMRKAEAGNAGMSVSSSFASSLNASKGTGSPLPQATKNFMENAFSTDFSDVRIHTETKASAMNNDINALAFTYGSNIYFNDGFYNPTSKEGQQLLAHELTHVVQQRQSNENIQRKRKRSRTQPGKTVDSSFSVNYIVLSCADQKMIFETSEGMKGYNLKDDCDLTPGKYTAEVKVNRDTLILDIGASAPKGVRFRFAYIIEAGRLTPIELLQNQKKVAIVVSADPIGAALENATSKPQQKDIVDNEEELFPYTQDELYLRCQQDLLPGVKTFPFRTTRFGGASIQARKEGDKIWVKQPYHVKTNGDFDKQTDTLPDEVFTGGYLINPNEIIKIHIYESRWWDPNITGSTSGDKQTDTCTTAESLLNLSDASTKAALFNIVLTGFEAATLCLPVGKVAGFFIKPAQRFGQRAFVAAAIGTAEAAPTAFAGMATRTSITLAEDRITSGIVGTAASQSVCKASSDVAASEALASFAERGGASVSGGGAMDFLQGAASRSVLPASTDLVGRGLIDAATDADVNQAIDAAADTSISGATGDLAGMITVAPEISAGFSTVEVAGAKKILGKPLTQGEARPFGDVWTSVANVGEEQLLASQNVARALYGRQRVRFWRAAARNLETKNLIEEMGFSFGKPGTAPFKILPNGTRITITLDHITEVQTANTLALSPENLRFAFGRENSVVLRL